MFLKNCNRPNNLELEKNDGKQLSKIGKHPEKQNQLIQDNTNGYQKLYSVNLEQTSFTKIFLRNLSEIAEVK